MLAMAALFGLLVTQGILTSASLSRDAGYVSPAMEKALVVVGFAAVFVGVYASIFPVLGNHRARWALAVAMGMLLVRRALDFSKQVPGDHWLFSDTVWNGSAQRVLAFVGIACIFWTMYLVSPQADQSRTDEDAVAPVLEEELSLRRLLLASVAVALAFGGLAAVFDFTADVGWLSRREEDFLDLIAAVAIGGYALWRIRGTVARTRGGKLVLIPTSFWLMNRVLNFTGGLDSIRASWIWGRDGEMHDSLVTFFGVGGGTALFLAIYVMARESDRARRMSYEADVRLDLEVRRREGAELAMQRAQRLDSLGLLAGGVAHDLNDLLTSLGGFVDLAREKLAVDHPAVEDLRLASVAGNRAADLARHLLTYSGNAPLAVEQVSLNAIVEDIAPLLRAAGPGVRLETSCDPDLPDIGGDATQIGQILLNLATNATEALPEKTGAIHIRTAAVQLSAERVRELSRFGWKPAPGEFVCLEVSDDGHGMPPEVAERVFDPFFSTKLAGRGLGLATVFGIVRAHGGSIDIASAPGQGTEIRAYLPLEGKTAMELAEVGTDANLDGRGALALVVDDDEAVRHVACATLECAGFATVGVRDAAGALEMMGEHAEIALVVLDIVMPGMRGDALLERFPPELPVLVVSGYTGGEGVRIAAKGRRRSFLPKPFSPRSLTAAVAKLLEEGNVRTRPAEA